VTARRPTSRSRDSTSPSSGSRRSPSRSSTSRSSGPLPRVRGLFVRLARLLLPADYRRFVDDIGETFAARLTRRRARGRCVALACLARELGSLIVLAARERLHRARRSGRGNDREPRLRALPGLLGWELRQAARSWRRSRSLFAGLVVTIGVALAGATVVTSVLDTLLWPLPVDSPEGLVAPLVLRDRDPFLVSARDVLAWRESAPVFESVGAALPLSVTLRVDERPTRIAAAAITPDYLPTLGVEVAVGRALSADDEGESAPVLIGARLWRSLLGGDPRLEGRSVLLDGRRHSVAGVLPPGFDLPFGAQVWLPLRIDPASGSSSRELSAVGRLAPGASVSDAERAVRALADRLELAHPETHRGWSAGVVGLRNQLVGDLDGRLRPTVRVLLLTVSALLLLAAANAIYLLAARTARRRRELAMRRALGADDWRLLRQLGFETLLPVLAAALLGIGIAHLAVARLAEWSPLRGLALESARTLRVDAGSSLAILLLALALGVALTLLAAFGAGALRAGALGATRRRLLLEACGWPLRATAAGMVAGSLAALAAGRGLAALLGEVRLFDPRVLVAVAAVTLAVALAAAWLPARAAQREDPVSSLRAE